MKTEDSKYNLPQGWSITTIKDLVGGKESFLKDGDWIESKDQNPSGEVRLIQLADIGDGEFKDKSNRYMTLTRAKELNCTFLEKGDILVARMPEPLGRACIFPIEGKEKFVTVVDVAIIRTGIGGVDNRLLMTFLNTPQFREKIKALQSGSTRKRISRNNLGSIEFPLPPVREQNRIASKVDSLFSELDNAVHHLKLCQKQLGIYRQALLKQAFEGKLTQEWRKENNPESSEKLLKSIKEKRQARYEQELNDWKTVVKKWEVDGSIGKRPSKPKKLKFVDKVIESEVSLLPPVPKEWNYTKLGNVGKLDRGKSKHRPRNDPRLFGGPYPFIQTAEVRNSKIKIREYEKTYSEFGLEQSKLWKKGTLCITIAANIAETAFLGFDACFPDSVVGFIPEDGFSDKFAFYFFEFSKSKIAEFAPATAQKNINLNILNNLNIPFCNLKEQIEIVNYIDSVFSVIENVEVAIETCLLKSESLRQSTLKKSFEGKLVDQDPKDEASSELLKRIKIDKEKCFDEQKLQKRKLPKRTKKMSKALSIKEVLKTSDKSMLARDVWQQSEHKDDIEKFYSELKAIKASIKQVKEGTQSLLSLRS